MVTMPSLPEFASALGMTMFVGAARADANAEQLVALRASMEPTNGRLQPLIRAGKWAEARKIVQDIMGPDWVPALQWRQHGA